MTRSQSRVISIASALRWILPRANTEGASPHNWAWIALETLVACGAVLAFRLWVEPDDPFGLQAQFPWLWIVPTLLAMRYGTPIGVASVLLLILSWLLLQQHATGSALADFPREYFLGGLILNLIAGQFSDIWAARTRRLRAVNAYLDERLNTLTKNHFLLRLSHERLEQDLLAKPLTLRETLLRLRELTSVAPASVEEPLPGAYDFMQLLGQSCQLEIAAIYPMDANGGPIATPAAIIGSAGELAINDPLVRYSLAQNALAHVQTVAATVETRDASRYLICAPLLASSGPAPAFVTVERMPFFALNDDTLQLLSVLIGYYADGLQLGAVAREVLERVPACPPEMALDIVRLHRIRASAGIDSSLVALVFESDSASLDMFEQVKRFKRGVDLAWELSSAKHQVLITLLPLAGAAAVEGYLLRIESAMHAQFGADFLSSHVGTHTAHIGNASPAETLLDLVARCGL